jgi:hypothetical protein
MGVFNEKKREWSETIPYEKQKDPHCVEKSIKAMLS